MRRLALIWCLLLAGIDCIGQSDAFWQSRDSNYNISISGSAPSYTGPGDIISGAKIFIGLRAYNAAYATGSNPAADVCDAATGLTCSTINILSSGYFDTATAAASLACAVKCIITKFYDQTGNGNDFTSVSSSGILTFNCLSTYPCIDTSAGANPYSGTTLTQASPMTLWAISNRTSGSSYSTLFGATTADTEFGFVNASDAYIYGNPNELDLTGVSNNTWHALLSILNGSSSSINADGTQQTGTLGTSGITSSANAFLAFNAGGTQAVFAFTMEFGLWPSAFSAGNITAMNANGHAAYGGF